MFKILISLLFVSSTWILTVNAVGKVDHHVKQSSSLPQNATRLSKPLYRKLLKIMKFSHAFRNLSIEEAVNFLNGIDEWKIPEDFETRFPYYLGGYDEDDKPIWYAETGKYRFDDLFERTHELFPIIEKIFFKMAINVAQSFVARERPGREIRQGVIVIDCDGFDPSLAYKIIQHPEVIQFGMRLWSSYLDILIYVTAQAIVVNANYAMKMMTDLFRPVMGDLMERIVILGGNKYRWKAELRRLLPENTIPPWYGGSKDFKPLAVYG